MDIAKILDFTGYPASVVAKKIGMQRGTFNNKLKGNNGASFTEEEIEQIRKVLLNVGNFILNEVNK